MRSDRYFNTEGVCIPQLHYMVRLDDRLKEIKRLFATLQAPAEYLKADYLVLSMDFKRLGLRNIEMKIRLRGRLRKY